MNYTKSNGVLVIDEDCSRLVSPLHWASTKEERLGGAINQSRSEQVYDLKDVVMDRRRSADLTSDNTRSAGDCTIPLPYDVHPPRSSFMGLLLGSGENNDLTGPYYPETMADCQFLLDSFIENVEPIIHLLHHPTLQKHFRAHLSHVGFYASPTSKDQGDSEVPRHFEPLAFSIFFSSVYSMDPTGVQTRFGVSKSGLLRRFQNGLEIALEKQDLLSSPAVPVLQAFVLFLVCLFTIFLFVIGLTKNFRHVCAGMTISSACGPW